ncbi:preprotein translocase subunit YajC [Lachnospiraceae bacterium OttesenSCG-928-D06]|nr:preprotein translocase subunit YajC [Lachnospiraceae bacterium OttesenSCG-928-D06]
MGMIVTFAIYAVLIGGMWFFMSRPQKKEQKRMAALLASLEVNDSVLTSAGFYGTVIDIRDDMVIVEFGNNRNCRIPMEKSAIRSVEKPGESI